MRCSTPARPASCRCEPSAAMPGIGRSNSSIGACRHAKERELMVFNANDFDKPEYEFFTPDGDKRFPWTPVHGDKTGQLSEIILSGSHESGWVTRLLKFEPDSDTTVNGTFTHDVWEEVFILEGEIHDIPLGQT